MLAYEGWDKDKSTNFKGVLNVLAQGCESTDPVLVWPESECSRTFAFQISYSLHLGLSLLTVFVLLLDYHVM